MPELQHRYAFEKKGPGPDQWELHRQEIIDLYSRRSLEEVREHMLAKHGFEARYDTCSRRGGYN
jgi:hypothetical protein